MKNPRIMLISLIMAVALISATSAIAATHTWDGGGVDGNFSTDANWVGDTDVSAVFAAGDILVFPNFNYAGANQPIANEAYNGIASMTFDSTSSAIVLTITANTTMQAGGSITVSGGANGVTIADGGAANLRADGALTIDNDDAGGLTISDRLYCASGNLLTISGSENITFTGNIDEIATNTPVTINMDAANDIVALNGTNTFAGLLTVTQGTASLGDVQGFGTGAGGISLGGGILHVNTAINAAAWTPTVTLTAPSTIDVDATSEIDTAVNNGGNDLTIRGTENIELSGIVSGGGALIMMMTTFTDVLTLSGANTYTGATTCTVGTLNVQNDTGTGTVAGGVSVAAFSAKLQLEGGITVGNEALTLNGSGGTIEMENVSGANTWGGAITLAAGTVDIQSTAGTLTLGSTISCGGQNLEFEGAGNTIVTGAIGPAAATTLTKNGTGTLQLNAINAYTGLTTVNAGTLAGTCTIDGPVTVAAGANLSPGASLGGAVGTMTIDGTVTLNGESKYLLSVEGGATDTINVTTGNFTATLSAPNIELETGYNSAGLALPSTVINLSGGGLYTALDESSLPGGWDIDDAKVGNLVRLTSAGSTVPTLNEWGMIITMILLAGTAVTAMRKRRAGMRNIHVA